MSFEEFTLPPHGHTNTHMRTHTDAHTCIHTHTPVNFKHQYSSKLFSKRNTHLSFFEALGCMCILDMPVLDALNMYLNLCT